ncbi:MAG: alpha/beta hydrolase [Phenylobacterium sp.]
MSIVDPSPPEAPAWFEAALEQAPEVLRVPVDGAEIEVLAWGERGRPGLLLMHGFLCSADWWRFTAPLLARDFRVAALSWSGMGGSGWRESYSFDLMAEEAMAAAQAAGLFEAKARPVFVGHSFGTLPLMVLADRYGERLGGVAAVETLLQIGTDQRASRPDPAPYRDFATREEAMARFRVSPPAPLAPPWVIRFLADRAVQEAPAPGGGSRWLLGGDRDLSRKTLRRSLVDHFSAIRRPLLMITGTESGMFEGEGKAWLREREPPQTVWIDMPGAGHFPMLDQPLALVDHLRAFALDCVAREARR